MLKTGIEAICLSLDLSTSTSYSERWNNKYSTSLVLLLPLHRKGKKTRNLHNTLQLNTILGHFIFR